MKLKSEPVKLIVIAAVFLLCYFMPVDWASFYKPLLESLALTKWYAREHVLLCLVPAFFIAGAISVFVSKASVMKYLGVKAHKALAYSVAAVSGSILAVCSCTILPLFAGIYKMGAGLGPATTFLYAGPAINVLAIILTARILGMEMGIARAVGAIIFSVVIGFAMHLIFRKEEIEKADASMVLPEEETRRSLFKNALYFASMVGILVFANWARSGDYRAVFLCCPGGLSTYSVEGTLLDKTDSGIIIRDTSGQEKEIPAELITKHGESPKNEIYELIFRFKWTVVFALLAVFAVMTYLWFTRAETTEWVQSSWGYAKQILPLLLLGVLVAGFLLGRPGPTNEGIIPSEWVNKLVGGNSIMANLFAAVAGAFMYFATLTEVPILQGLMGSGMGKGPALALLLAGPALSLPNMLVIRSVMGTKKTLVFVLLVIFIAALSGIIYGTIF